MTEHVFSDTAVRQLATMWSEHQRRMRNPDGHRARWMNSTSADTVRAGRITGMAAEAIATIEIASVPVFSLTDRPPPTSDVGSGDDGCVADDEVDQTLNGYIGSHLGDPTGETCYAFAGHAISSFYASCAAASTTATCGAIIQRTPWSCWRDPASGSEPGGASGGLMPEPLYVIIEADCEAIVKTWDSIECCGESSGAESGSLTKIGEWQALLLAKKLCCAVGECPDDPASTCG